MRHQQPRRPHQSCGLHPKRERIGHLEQVPERFEGRCCTQVDRDLLPITVRRLLVKDVDVETGQMGACSYGIHPALPIVCSLRHAGSVQRFIPLDTGRNGLADYRASFAGTEAGNCCCPSISPETLSSLVEHDGGAREQSNSRAFRSRSDRLGKKLEHDPEKCAAVFRKDHAQSKS